MEVTSREILPDEQIIERFMNFLLNFTILDEEGKDFYKYREEILQIIADETRRSIVVDFPDLALFDQELADNLLKTPLKVINLFNVAFRRSIKLLQEDISEDTLRKYRVRIKNIGKPISIRELHRAENLGKIINFKGIVVKAIKIKPILRRAMFRCLVCGFNFPLEFEDEFQKPTVCLNPTCDNNNPNRFEMMKESLEYEEYQELTIQELPEELPPGQLPQGVVTVVRGDLTSKVRPGDRVTVYGVVKTFPERGLRAGKKPLFDIVIETLYIDSESGELEEIELTEEEKDIIESLKNSEDLENKIYQSIAPSIYGYERIKKAIAALLFGGVPKVLPDGTKIRGTINILLIGDPGTGKSQLLKYVAQISPRALYTSGRGSSAAGLTAAVVKSDDGWALEAGVLVLADKGIACIDEFDKMSRDDRRALHEAMEQQSISIAKAGIVATLNARTSILAAANPKFGRYLPERNLAENLDLPPTILSRFDLIFVLVDIPKKEEDYKMASHILGLHTRDIRPEPPFSPEFLKKYILYAKEHVFPKLTKEAAKKILDFYMKMRAMSKEESEESLGMSPVAITARQLEALVRLTEARARMLLKEEADESDADFAIELMTYSLSQVGRDPESGHIDIGIVSTGVSSSKRARYLQVMDILRELESEYPDGVPIKRIIEEAKQKKISEDFVIEVLNREKNKGNVYEPRPGKYKSVSY